MPRRPKDRTFTEILTEPTWSESEAARSGQHAPRPGTFNAAGDFFDPHGTRLEPVRDDVTPDEAQRLVDAGALVVHEACGCGGWGAGCTPTWLGDERLAQLRRGPEPRFTHRSGAPTWIDVWANDERSVVYAHGDVLWGSAIG
ncbi:hypothetical protein GCM10009868_05140 [Terrabacter aerolatus]|uniref:Uncharacterized protein n=1 Tax=Terrabacter aerolatus TaxID=422442 RepID=A0A512CZ28_9MICO|nr:hypothetical protein [Terrabacter aerolatus]GEO29465.1 hypothetical protein TAE01_12750 [Terrabacter aerolatus]